MKYFGICVACLLALAGCRSDPHNVFTGYVEGTFLKLASVNTGRIEKLFVRKGDVVQKGEPLFSLEETPILTSVKKARAAYKRATLKYNRLQKLLKEDSISQADFDDAESLFQQTKAELEQASWMQENTIIRSPKNGTVHNILRRPGEMTSPQLPVIDLQNNAAEKVRIFVPQQILPLIHVAKSVLLKADGMIKGVSGRISYISAQAEYNPPVLYNMGSREKLTYLVEVTPSSNQVFKPGQPVDVTVSFSDE